MYTKVLCPRILYAPSAVRILLYLRSRTNTEKIKKRRVQRVFFVLKLS